MCLLRSYRREMISFIYFSLNRFCVFEIRNYQKSRNQEKNDTA